MLASECGTALPYARFIISNFFSRKLFGSSLDTYLKRHTRVNALWNAPPLTSPTPFPVVVYTHGQSSLPEKNTWLCEEMASHGFAVAAVYHDDESKYHPGPLERRQMDIYFCIECLTQLSANTNLPAELAPSATNPFAARLALGPSGGVAVVGHSFGATSVLLACAQRASDKLFECEKEGATKSRVSPIVFGAALDAWYVACD